MSKIVGGLVRAHFLVDMSRVAMICFGILEARLIMSLWPGFLGVMIIVQSCCRVYSFWLMVIHVLCN